MLRSRSPLRTALSAALAAGTAAACGSTVDPIDDFDENTAITDARARRYYGDTTVAFERAVFYWADRVNWSAQRASVLAEVAAAQTHGDLWKAAARSIDPWLHDAPPDGPDEHSAFFDPTISPGVVDASPDPRNLPQGTVLAETGRPTLAYLYLPGFTGKSINGRADSIQAVIRTLDASNPCGWVLDLRRNLGGYTDAMMAGINPIFGDAPASRTQGGWGGEVDREGGRALWFVQGGQSGVYDPAQNRAYTFARTSQAYTLRRPNSPVAILTGINTASASEAITLGFRGGPVPTRSFGQPTRGVTTGPYGMYLLPDSGLLNITASVMFDRTGRLYGRAIAPDEVVTGGPTYNTFTVEPSPTDPVINAATAWLRQQSACGAAASRAPSAEPRLARAVAPSALPGREQPLSPETRKPRVFAVPAAARGR